MTLMKGASEDLPFVSNVATSGDAINDGEFKKMLFSSRRHSITAIGTINPERKYRFGGSNWAYSQVVYEASPLK